MKCNIKFDEDNEVQYKMLFSAIWCSEYKCYTAFHIALHDTLHCPSANSTVHLITHHMACDCSVYNTALNFILHFTAFLYNTYIALDCTQLFISSKVQWQVHKTYDIWYNIMCNEPK